MKPLTAIMLISTSALILAQESLLFEDDFNQADGPDFGPQWQVFYRAITACQTPWPVPAIEDSAFVGRNENANGTMRLVKEFESTVTRITFDYVPEYAEQEEVGIGVSVFFHLKDSYYLQVIRSYYGDDTYGWGEEQPDSAVDILIEGAWDGVPRTMTLAVDSIAEAAFGIADPETIDYTEVWIGMHANKCGAVAGGAIDNVKIYGITSTDLRAPLEFGAQPGPVGSTAGDQSGYDLKGRRIPPAVFGEGFSAAGQYFLRGPIAGSVGWVLIPDCANPN